MLERPTLGIRASAGGPPSPSERIRTAIKSRLLLEAVYNRTRIKLAPYALYTEPGGVFADGVVVERDGEPPRELKLGRFKLAGLKELAATSDEFTPEPFFEGGDPKYRGGTVVTTGAAAVSGQDSA